MWPGLQGTDHSLRYLSLHDNRYLRYFQGHTARVTTLCMSPLSDQVISAAQACPYPTLSLSAQHLCERRPALVEKWWLSEKQCHAPASIELCAQRLPCSCIAVACTYRRRTQERGDRTD